MHGLYILRFEDGAQYIGASSDVDFRIGRHETLAKTYAGRVNFVVESRIECATRREAWELERRALQAAKAAGTVLRNGEQAAHFKGVPKSAETCRKISVAKRGKCLGPRKITKSQGIQMFVMQATAGWTQVELAKSFNVSRSTVRKALAGSRAA
jgi:predicted GIY-YIG superfamily endonuclease